MLPFHITNNDDNHYNHFSTPHLHEHIHTHTHLTALCPGLPRSAGTGKVKPIWILLKQETVSGSGISWAICKSAPRSRHITMPAPYNSLFYKPDALPAAQPTVSKHSINYSDTQRMPREWDQKGNQNMDHANVASHLGIAFSHVFMSCKQAIAHKTMISHTCNYACVWNLPNLANASPTYPEWFTLLDLAHPACSAQGASKSACILSSYHINITTHFGKKIYRHGSVAHKSHFHT